MKKRKSSTRSKLRQPKKKSKRERPKIWRERVVNILRVRSLEEEAQIEECKVLNRSITKQCNVRLEFPSVVQSLSSLLQNQRPIRHLTNLSRIKDPLSTVIIAKSLITRMIQLHIVKSATSISSLQLSQLSPNSLRTHL